MPPAEGEGYIPWLIGKILGRSWATSVGGLLVAAPMVIPELAKLFDGDPSTAPAWGVVVSGLGAAALGRVARTDWVTSEQAGAGGRPRNPRRPYRAP